MAAEFKLSVDPWDWARPMKQVSKSFTGTPGVVLHLGDSLTYANQATRWAWYYGINKSKEGYTPSDEAILDWTHANKTDSPLNGWWQAKVDVAPGRSLTAASGIRTDQYEQGGYRGMPSLKSILESYYPQMAVVLLGTNDAKHGKSVASVVVNMKRIINTIRSNHTIPVMITLPPSTGFHDTVIAYNAAYQTLAKAEEIPLIDLYGEIMVRAKDTWETDILHTDGIHLTLTLANGPATDENLKRCGYLLRCWLVVQKLKVIKANVIDK